MKKGIAKHNVGRIKTLHSDSSLDANLAIFSPAAFSSIDDGCCKQWEIHYYAADAVLLA